MRFKGRRARRAAGEVAATRVESTLQLASGPRTKPSVGSVASRRGVPRQA